ncbi:hypothetical protein [Bradyrhizobium sp. CCBAU 11430]|uniref:hypothetical protein n=1 Tax=Bradyrhizobium sp. CCBAU 11430 TaxID=1630881 RepID=UPI00230532D7|nr:hypothetical protein [Bradyrhizobium sp. CCBAU 11430]
MTKSLSWSRLSSVGSTNRSNEPRLLLTVVPRDDAQELTERFGLQYRCEAAAAFAGRLLALLRRLQRNMANQRVSGVARCAAVRHRQPEYVRQDRREPPHCVVVCRERAAASKL